MSDRPAETPTPDSDPATQPLGHAAEEPATQPLGHATEEPTTQPLDYAGSEPADEPVQQTGEPAGPPAPEPGAPSGPAGATPWRPASERSDGDEPPVWSAATLSERSEEPPRRIRTGTLVFGILIALIGLGAIVTGLGFRLDLQLALAALLVVAAVILLASPLLQRRSPK